MKFDFSILDFFAWLFLGLIGFFVISLIVWFIFWIDSKIGFSKEKKTIRKDDGGGDVQCKK